MRARAHTKQKQVGLYIVECFRRHLRWLECLSELVLEFPFWIYGKYSHDRYPDSTVRPHVLHDSKRREDEKLAFRSRWCHSDGVTHIDAIAIAGIEWILRKQCLNVTQAGDFELFGLSFDHLSVECRNQRCWIQKQRAVRQLHITLLNRAQIIASRLK